MGSKTQVLHDFINWYNEHYPKNYIPNSRLGNYLQLYEGNETSDENNNFSKTHGVSLLPKKCNCGQNCLPYDAVFTVKKCKRCGNEC